MQETKFFMGEHLMFDFNDPKMTTQMKKDLLSLSIPEVKEQRLRDSKIAKERGLNISSPSYWVVKPDQLLEMNRWTYENTDCKFILNDYAIEGLHPNTDIVLFEHDRVEKGEFDSFRNRVSPYGYTQTNVMIFNGTFSGEIPSGVEDFDATDGETVLTQHIPINPEEDYKDYPSSLRHKDEKFFSGGLVDCPNHLLNELENQRTNKRTWIFSRFYEQTMDEYCETVFGSSHPFNKVKKKKDKDKGFG